MVELAADPRPWQRIVLRTGKAYDIVYGEKIGRVIHLFDERQFMVDGIADGIRELIAKAFMGAPPGEKGNFLLRRSSIRGDLFRDKHISIH